MLINLMIQPSTLHHKPAVVNAMAIGCSIHFNGPKSFLISCCCCTACASWLSVHRRSARVFGGSYPFVKKLLEMLLSFDNLWHEPALIHNFVSYFLHKQIFGSNKCFSASRGTRLTVTTVLLQIILFFLPRIYQNIVNIYHCFFGKTICLFCKFYRWCHTDSLYICQHILIRSSKYYSR